MSSAVTSTGAPGGSSGPAGRGTIRRSTLGRGSFWSPLTTRARTLLIAGAVLLVAGLVIGEIDLVRVGVFALTLPVVAVLVVTRARLRVACSRHSDPPVAVAGSSVEVVLTLTNRSMVPVGALHLEDRMPSHLAGQARFTLAGLGPNASRAVTYRLTDVRRGRYVTGPLRIRIDDAFGLVDVVRSFTGRSEVLVTPRIEALGPAGPATTWDVGDHAGSRSVGALGAEDASIREYRQGDDLRKIHWRSTARTGSMMVRQDERPWQGRVTVLLDARRVAHATAPDLGADVDLRERDSLEWAVSAAASIADRNLAAGRDTGLLHDAPPIGATPAPGAPPAAWMPTRLGLAGPREVANHLADLTASTRPDLERLLPAVRVAARESVVLAVLGELDPTSLDGLAAVAASSTRGGGTLLAVVVDVAGWRRGDPGPRSPGHSVADVDAEEPVAATRLRAAGWVVAVARHGEDVATVWDRLVAAAGSGGLRSDEARAVGHA